MPVRLCRQDDRSIAGVQGGRYEARETIDDGGLILTEADLVTMWYRKARGFGKRHTGAHELLAAEYCVDGGEQINPGTWLVNVRMAAETERLFDDVRR